MFAFFLSSGLFLGWSLGANDASNVFGTAVGRKMIRFKTAAICCSIFIILGSVLSGAGASHTLGKLGSVNAIAGAFIVAFAAALSVYLMTRMRFPVSTSQAIVGAIIGWNIFSGSVTETNSLAKIVITWVACPALAAVLAIILYKIVVFIIHHFNIHMFGLDSMTRWGLLLVGAFGSYSLGANNIANVMGVFIPVSPFTDISIFGVFNLSSAQQLFFIGGVAIAIGVLTYSRRVMETVGEGIMKLSPVAAFAVVSAHSLVLFLFASQGLERFLISHGLPAISLVPVSSSQAIVGAVIGIGLLKGGRGIRWRTLGGISSGWVLTPIIAGVFSLLSLFFLQNVFHQNTYQPITYRLTPAAMARINEAGISTQYLVGLADKDFDTAVQFNNALDKRVKINSMQHDYILSSAEIDKLKITQAAIDTVNTNWISPEQLNALKKLKGRSFEHKWQLVQALGGETPAWQFSQNSKSQNDKLNNRLANLYSIFRQ